MSVQLAEPTAQQGTGGEAITQPWWQGVWFEGAFDPKGVAFALALALGATVAMVVVAAAAMRILAGT